MLLSLTALNARSATLYYVVDGIRYAVNTETSTAMVTTYALYKGMSDIQIPSSIEEDGKTFPVVGIEGSCFKNCTQLKSISLSASLIDLGEYCFQGCTNLKSLILPNSVTKLGQGCFQGCTKLDWVEAYSSLKYLGASCFEGDTCLVKISFSDPSVLEIGSNCFSGCTNLVSIKIPNTVRRIGKQCFANCTNLEKIVFPDSITRLTATFYNCKRLKSITLPALTKTLSDHDWYKFTIANAGGCFDGCTSLTEITIPESVTEMGSLCFHGCENLSKVTCYAVTPPKTSNSFEDENKKMLYVPETSVYAYKAAEEWKDFGNILSLDATGIRSMSEDKIGMTFEDGKLSLTNVPAYEMVSVYTTTGTLLGSGRGDITVYATRGQIVIAKFGTHTYKLLLK